MCSIVLTVTVSTYCLVEVFWVSVLLVYEAHILETAHAKHTIVNSSLDYITTLTKLGTHESAT